MSEAVQDRSASSDPVSHVIWQEGHLSGGAAPAPLINAPRASDLVAHDAA